MFILPLSSNKNTLENAGGKGVNLVRLTRLGLRVPPGFIILTEAYRQFVEANNLERVIHSAIKDATAEEADTLERASARIREAFSACQLTEETAQELAEGLYALDPPSSGVAVRSSATAEDLPELSFAGQQDTFLNVIGEVQLNRAVVDCWSSLWTARAIGYRLRNGIPNEGIDLAVIVQRMVPSDISGVLFTANPLTGLRSEMVIDATFGLGDALVSGQVEPDQYTVDAQIGAILAQKLGSKQKSTRAKVDGGVEVVPEEAADRQVLSAEQTRQLAAIGSQIQEAMSCPQDIEWAYSGDELHILQARPITSLFPIPRISFDPLIIWASFGAVQGMVGPMTTLGQEAIQRVVLGVGARLKIKLDLDKQELFVSSGERIWIKFSDVIRNPLGFRIYNFLLEYIEPSIARIMQQLNTDPRMGAGQGGFKFSTLRRMMRFFLPIALRMPGSMLFPKARRADFDYRLEQYLQTVRISPGADRFERLANFAHYMEAQGGVADALPTLLPWFIPVFGPAMASLNLITRQLPREARQDPRFTHLVMEVTRGLPNNVTIEMDLALWKAATIIKNDTAAAKIFRTSQAEALADRYLQGNLPMAAQEAVRSFLERYGMRGVGEIDLGQPRWGDDPRPILETLQSYLQIPPELAPDLVFERGRQSAEKAIETLAAEVRCQTGGWIKEKLLRAATRRVRLLMGARESPKFFAVRAMGRVRSVLLAIGDEFVADGTINSREDLFHLHVSELAALARGEQKDWKALIAERRRVYQNELRRRQVPRLLVSDGRVFHEGLGAGTDDEYTISGNPVSPGLVEGVVRVVLDPRKAHLNPGEILVCPGTDPAWTPLFMAAGGLVMEVGGMMTHGSVVAREYGIPAVVGVHRATQRLRDGQRIRVDGVSGRIVLL